MILSYTAHGAMIFAKLLLKEALFPKRYICTFAQERTNTEYTPIAAAQRAKDTGCKLFLGIELRCSEK